jgi:hypothetical protein
LEDEGKIVGGTEASPGEVPFQVGMFQGTFQFCGGSILDDTTIITAAHCCNGQAANAIQIGYGHIDKTKVNYLLNTAFFGFYKNSKIQSSNKVAFLKKLLLPSADCAQKSAAIISMILVYHFWGIFDITILHFGAVIF